MSALRFTTSNYPFWHFQTFLTPKTIVYHCFYYSLLINIHFIWIIILVLCHRRHLFFISGVYYLHQTFFTKIQVSPCHVSLKCPVTSQKSDYAFVLTNFRIDSVVFLVFHFGSFRYVCQKKKEKKK